MKGTSVSDEEALVAYGGGVSRTALGSAYWRAAHLRDDPPPWILEDRIAETILSADDVTELEAPLVGWDPSVAAGFRLHHVIRARVAEDVAVLGLDTGRTDYAILGAGADTFAWRHRQASQFTVWEYDLAATQAWKRQALIDAGLGVPSNVRFVTIDLATTRLDAVDVPARATWSWMGVTMYLTPEAMTEVLDALAHLGTGTTVVANFALPPDECDELGLAAARSAASLVASVGEPVVATYRRGDVAPLFRAAGFNQVELLDAVELSRRYLRDHKDRMLPDSTVIAVAVV
jgi:methyltransferase (TIGR00027 family)